MRTFDVQRDINKLLDQVDLTDDLMGTSMDVCPDRRRL